MPPESDDKREGEVAVVVELRKASKKQIRRLREGHGRLMEEARGCVGQLKRDGELDENAVPVYVIVQRKSRRWSRLFY